jgi:hypothetical protein
MDEIEKYHIVFEERAEYFLACLEAEELSSELIAEYQQKIAHGVQRQRYHRVMIKRDVKHSTTSAELYRIPLMVDSDNYRGIKYAFVDMNAPYTKTYKLAMLHLKGRGFDIEVFGDMRAAENWLLRPNGNGRSPADKNIT